MSGNPPSFIQFKGWNFLITDAPTDETLDAYLKILKKHNVHCLVRACDPSYELAKLTKKKIEVHELPFADGGFPTHDIIKEWTELCHKVFAQSTPEKEEAIAVHCVAGLGRAPVLVALALIECGMSWQQAVEEIRKKRNGAINTFQLQQLKHYKAKGSCEVM